MMVTQVRAASQHSLVVREGEVSSLEEVTMVSDEAIMVTRGLMMEVPDPLSTPHRAVTITLSGWRPAAWSTPTTIFFILSCHKVK